MSTSQSGLTQEMAEYAERMVWLAKNLTPPTTRHAGSTQVPADPPEEACHRRLSVLEEAQQIIYGDREKTYGKPAKNLEMIAALWSAYFDRPFTAQEVAIAMVLLKLARQANTYHRDNLVDVCGYAALIERVNEGV